MNMKNLINLLITSAFAVSSACAQTATQSGPEWRATVRAVDETGQPVAGAKVTIGYYVKPPHDEPGSIATDAKRGVTDTNGFFSAAAHSTSVDLTFGVEKE